MSATVLGKIEQYQKSIEKHQGNEEKLLYYIKKLSQLPVTVAHLQATGVGRTINSLRKCNGDVRAAAKSLVSKWKDMVASEEADEEEEVENRPERVVETRYTSPDSYAVKRRGSDNHADRSDRKRRKEHSPDRYRSPHHHRERNDERRKEPDEKLPTSNDYDNSIASPDIDSVYENGHYSESDDNELRIEDDVKEEESQAASDDEPSPRAVQRSMSQDSDDAIQLSPEPEESMKKASSSKSHSHKDSKHRESSKHHHESKDKLSQKDHSGRSSSSQKKEEKRDKSEKSHRKHEKYKSKESSRDDEDRKSPKKSHHSSSSDRKYKDKESRSKDSREKQNPLKSKVEKTDVKIKQEPVDTHEVKIKQEPIDNYSDKSSSEKADKSENRKSSSSSGSSKNEKHKDKRKSSDKDKSKEKKEEKKSSQKEKLKDLEDEGVDSFSGASFGDVLGMIGPKKSSKKKSLSSPSTSKGVAGYDPLRPDLNYEKSKSKYSSKDMLDSPSEEEFGYNSIRPSAVEEDLLLPEISPHYKPLPHPNYSISPTKKVISVEDSLNHIISSKSQRTKVYSGNKSGYTHVPSLFEICTRVLQENIEALGYTGGVPFHLLKPVLEHATAEQLHQLEHCNPYLIEDTDGIWEFHCQKDFRNKKREEMETWRDMYLRCFDEREQKLKTLTSSIQNSMSKWTPVRKTKLAYVEGTVKPPRGVARKQAKYGSGDAKTSSLTSKFSSSSAPKPSTSSSQTTSSSFGGRQAVLAAPTVSVPNPRAGSSHSSSASLKPKPKAPLMQKALQLVRNRYKR